MISCDSFYHYDVVGYKIVSPLHLVSLLAFCDRHFAGRRPKVLIVLSQGPWARKILDLTSLNNSRYQISVVEEEDVQRFQGYHYLFFMALRPFFSFFNPLAPKGVFFCSTSLASLKGSSFSLRSLVRIVPFILDEGIGSYNVGKNINLEVSSGAGNFLSRCLKRFLLKLIYSRSVFFDCKKELLFQKKGGRVILDKNVKDSFINALKALYPNDKKAVVADVLLLTQPCIEMGIVEEGEYFLYMGLIQEYAHRFGRNMIVKPHPAECFARYERYGFRVLHDSRPIEGVVAAEEIEINEVWGFSSTSLVTLPALFGIESKQIQSPWQEINLSRFGGESLELFKQYSDLVPFSALSEPANR